MKISEVVGHVNGFPIWKYSREEGDYLVREFGVPKGRKRNYIVKSPSEKLYSFSEYDGDLSQLFTLIKRGKADKERYVCELESIYDEL